MILSMKAARINAGYNQEDVLEPLGVSAKTLSFYETGKRSPNIRTALKMCELYHVTLNDIDWSGENENI